jgi:glycosyltransferase involved in cell wall biosynthesis
LNVGAFEERKNQLTLLEAYHKISHEFSHHLIFIGQGKKYLEKVRARAQELGIADRVHFLSNVNSADLPVFFQMADLFCFPSIFEGFGIPIVEALFSRTPVLTSFGSCFPESAGPQSHYVDPLSIADISKGIRTILASDALQNKMKIEGELFARQFKKEYTTEKLLHVYHQTIS